VALSIGRCSAERRCNKQLSCYFDHHNYSKVSLVLSSFFFFQVTKTGATRSRLAAYESKRKGPKRHDGKAWKAGEAGCPKAPVYEPLTDGAPVIVKGKKEHEFMCLCLFHVIIMTASYMLSHVKLQKLKQGDLRLKRIHFVHPPKVSSII
jgi:hypothetical protein